jgi:hypothetical protein
VVPALLRAAGLAESAHIISGVKQMFSRIRCLTIFSAAAMLAACSQGANQVAPTGPSAASFSSGAAGWSTASGTADLSFAIGAVNGGSKKVAGAGTVANLTGTCPDELSMVVQGVRVVTDGSTDFFIDATTPIEGGCENLRPGTKVVVVAGDTPTDGAYLAESITIVDQPGGKPPSPVEGEGTIAALKGTCPGLTMVIHGYPVMTTSATDYGTGSCEALTAGTKVRVEGVLAGNSVVADSVEVLAPATP